MSQKSLEDLLQAAGGPVKLLRESQTGPYVYPVVPPEYSNWRDERGAALEHRAGKPEHPPARRLEVQQRQERR